MTRWCNILRGGSRLGFANARSLWRLWRASLPPKNVVKQNVVQRIRSFVRLSSGARPSAAAVEPVDWRRVAVVAGRRDGRAAGASRSSRASLGHVPVPRVRLVGQHAPLSVSTRLTRCRTCLTSSAKTARHCSLRSVDVRMFFIRAAVDMSYLRPAERASPPFFFSIP